ncbi:hypothetical protein GJV26_03945 [Massilia dura]|uniref:Uncharacterized protein n=1 Tax=Pseudoduganella dura TaxID=321982 RepID=A0A6I3X453_9BURK|nr:hypothetical protein [Pseudoduganella dura]MUI11639.1 hypothetical protein [Pseudoduganella dura]GGX77958.1 hypothetical protein GCM10007386_06150 [Pseudoduganella dura]
MTLVALLERIRRPYIDQLSHAATGPGFHVEPVVRRPDGSPAGDGLLDTPCRCDLVRKALGGVQSVDAAECVGIEPLRVELGGVPVAVSAFSWDWLNLHIAGIPDAEVNTLMRAWFLRWFDADDAYPRNAEGLRGVVHFLGDPARAGDGLRFRIDLGSAPASAVAELIEDLLRHGATGLALG